MSNQLHGELKKEFQLERLILFSDAVFAIAITLLVIEIKVPELNRHTATDRQLLEILAEMVPKFFGFLISFLIIGIYWTVHHRMFGYVVNYTPKMLWLNLFFLMAVVLMPFSTGFYSVYILRLLKVPVIIYVSNIVFLGLMNYLLWLHISNPKNNLVEGLDPADKKYFTFRSVFVPCIFITMALVYLIVSPRFAVLIPPFIPVIMRIAGFYYKKKLFAKKKK
jgi:uncharacterized membrane protein